MRVVLISICLLASTGLAQTNTPLLLRKPTVSKTQIVFNYGGDLWIAARDGGDARRLTAGMGNETDPLFSPDGTMIASRAITTATRTYTLSPVQAVLQSG
jgi:tricorn protease